MTTEEWLEKLERELARANRRNRWALILVALIAAVGLGASCTVEKTTATTIQAKELILKDENGRSRPRVAVSVNQGSPKEVLETMQKGIEAMDVDAIVACADPDYAKPMKLMAGIFKDMVGQLESLTKAAEDNVGKEQADMVRKLLEMMKDSGPLKDATKDGKIDWDKVDVRVEGDKATAKVGDEKPIQLRKISDKWYAVPELDNGKTSDDNLKSAEKDAKVVQRQIKALAEFEKSVRDGKVTKYNFEFELVNAFSLN